MSINLQKISDAINAKISSFGSSSPTSELVKIIESINNVNAHGGVITAPSKNALPLADSSNSGTIAFVRSTGYTDSAGTFYFGTGTDWSMLTTLSDSADSAGAATVVEGGSSFTMLGSSYGYTAGSVQFSGVPASNKIERYSFVSDGNAVDVGDMIAIRDNPAGLSSSVAGYRMSEADNRTTNVLTSEKMLFASEASSSTSALTAGRSSTASLHSADYGWLAGKTTAIEKYAYVADTFSTETPALAGNSLYMTGASSGTAGYVMGGYPYPGALGGNAIQKFPFTSGAVTESGHLLQPIMKGIGTSSETDGYHAGGQVGPPWTYTNPIQKFPFSSDGDTTDVGDLDQGRYGRSSSGNQSTAFGYNHGGLVQPSNYVVSNVIQKFPFSSDGNATDVGDLVTASFGHANNFV
jgi:hypothetical protein